ncbi:hypothetical protein R6Q57_013164 [Mikania cordata]
MGGRKKLNIITTDSNLAVKDHVVSKTQGLHTSEMQGGVSSSQEFQSTNEQGAPKKVRSLTQNAEIWKMVSNERILVMFNKFGKPVGDEGKELVQYLGTLVRMPKHVSIAYSDWRKVPMQQNDDMYSLVKSKFSFHQGETSQIKKWILYSMGKKWRTWKGILKSCGYDPSLTIDEIVTQQTNNDDRVNPSQFKELVKRWFTLEFQGRIPILVMKLSNDTNSNYGCQQ